ncbi:MAG: hypothetical protein H9W81_10100 [Enterococcus sp.]|nr:hypothetical protein [Enterococcus sp.]
MEPVTDTTATETTAGVITGTRDTIRIPHVLARLERYWMQNPDLRLGQIVGNIASTEKQDPYFVEDEILATHLEEMAPVWE